MTWLDGEFAAFMSQSGWHERIKLTVETYSCTDIGNLQQKDRQKEPRHAGIGVVKKQAGTLLMHLPDCLMLLFPRPWNMSLHCKGNMAFNILLYYCSTFSTAYKSIPARFVYIIML